MPKKVGKSSKKGSSGSGAKKASSSKKGANNTNKNDKKPNIPPPNNNGNQQQHQEPNIGALAALLLAVMALRQVMDHDVPQGQEITWKDFRNHLLDDVEQLVVVNKKICRIYLRDGAKGMPKLQSQEFAPTATATMMDDQHFNDNTQMDWGSTATADSSSLKDNIKSDPSSPSSNGNFYHFYIGSVESFEEKLTKAQQELGVQPRDFIPVQYVNETNWTVELIKSTPAIAMVGLTIWLLRSSGGMAGGRNGGGPGGIFQIGKSNAKKVSKEDVSVTFADVAGCQEAKKEIMEFVDFLQDSSRFTKLGAKIPKGALLCGPPGMYICPIAYFC